MNVNYETGDVTYTKQDDQYEEKLFADFAPFKWEGTSSPAYLIHLVLDIGGVNGIWCTSNSSSPMNAAYIGKCKLDYDKKMWLVIDEGILITNKALSNIHVTGDFKCFYINDNGFLHLFTSKNDFSTIVALSYGGEYYYKRNASSLTARPNDVIKDKIFIGNSGVPERGTLEVDNNE